MKAFVSVKSIIILLSLFIVMGASAIGLVTNSLLCVSQGKCDSIIKTVATTLLNSDKQVEDSVDIMTSEQFQNQQQIGGVPTSTLRGYLFWQLILGIFTMFIYFYIVFWFVTTFIARASKLEASSYIWVFVGGVALLALFQVLYQVIFEGAVTRIPFTGIVKLIQHPQVLTMFGEQSGLINQTILNQSAS
jgi:hypothetical protein